MGQIDQSALDTIRALQRPGSPDLLGRIIALFQTQTPDIVSTLMSAMETGDLEAVRVSAHSLKSSAAYIGANDYSQRMSNLEHAAREQHLDLCKELTTDLNDHTDAIISELDSLQDRAA